MNITILGGGAFGTSLAIHFANKNYNVRIWEFFKDQATEMQTNRENPLFPGFKLPSNIEVTSDLSTALKDSDKIFIAVPSHVLERTLQSAQEFIADQDFIICSKGFTQDLKLLSDVAKKYVKGDIYCLYGPTIAKELATGKLTGIVLAGKHNPELEEVIKSNNLRVEHSYDIVGVQVASALKNVVTIFVGIIEGMEYGDNAKSHVFVKGLHEIKQVGIALGAEETTFFRLTGLGDMLLTSRNRKLGQEVGKGRDLEEVLAENEHVFEGVTALKNVTELSKQLNLHLPVIQGLNKILFERVNAKEVVESL